MPVSGPGREDVVIERRILPTSHCLTATAARGSRRWSGSEDARHICITLPALRTSAAQRGPAMSRRRPFACPQNGVTDRTADYAHRVTDLEPACSPPTSPAPCSKELAARKSAAVSSGVATMPVYCQRRVFGGIVEDVDGTGFDRPGFGIAVTTIGNSSPLVVEAVREQVAEFTHTCFMVTRMRNTSPSPSTSTG